MRELRTHYQTLDVVSSASQSEIKQAYDRKRESLKSIKDILAHYKAEMPFSVAYQVLSDPEKRKKYDEEIFEKETKSPEDQSKISIKLPKEFCEILGVSSDASEQSIRAAFRKKALEVHPDKNPNDPNATENFQKLNTAFEKLMESFNQNNQTRAPKAKAKAEAESTASSSDLDEFLKAFRNSVRNTKSGWQPSKSSVHSSPGFFQQSSESGWKPSTKGSGGFFGFGGK